jgi:hypothetical protein
MSDTKAQDPKPQGHSHAPDQAQSPLALMGLISLVLGILFLVGRALVAPESLEVATEIEQKRDAFLGWAGGFLAIQGALLLILRVARDPHLGAGSELDGTVLENASLGARLLNLPRVVFRSRRAREFSNAALQVVLATGLLVLGNYVLARHELWRMDLTGSSIYTLSEESIRHVEGITDEIRVVVMLSPASQQSGGRVKEINALLAQYRGVNSRISFETFDPFAWPEETDRAQELKRLGIQGDTSSRALLGIEVQVGEREGDTFKVRRRKRISELDLWKQTREAANPRGPANSVFMGERQLTTAMLEVLDTKRPRVYFLSGHGEPSIGGVGDKRGLSYLTERLRDRGFEIKLLNLLESDDVVVPDDADCLVVAGPKNALATTEAEAIQAYVTRGGKLILLDEERAEMDPDSGEVEWVDLGLEKFLQQRYGIRSTDWLIALPIRDRAGRTGYTTDLNRFLNVGQRHPITQPLLGTNRPIAFRTIHALERIPVGGAGAIVEELVQTNRERGRMFRGFNNPRDPSDSDHRPGPFTLALASERQDGEIVSRVVVFGDVDWITNVILGPRNNANLELFLNSLNWCLRRENQLIGEAKRPQTYRLDMTTEQADRLKGLAMAGLPLLAMALGFLTWGLRRRS